MLTALLTINSIDLFGECAARNCKRVGKVVLVVFSYDFSVADLYLISKHCWRVIRVSFRFLRGIVKLGRRLHLLWLNKGLQRLNESLLV